MVALLRGMEIPLTRAPSKALIVGAGALDLAGSYLAFVVFDRGPFAYFVVSALIAASLVGLVILGLIVPAYLLLLWSLVGAVAQLPFLLEVGGLSVFACSALASVGAMKYLWDLRRITQREPGG